MPKGIKFSKSQIIAIAAVIVSLFSVYYSWQANLNSQQANKIALEAKNVNQEGVDFSKDVRSQQIAENAYNNIYDGAQAQSAIELMKTGSRVNNPDMTLKVVDSLEEAGISFCQGTAWVRHLKVYLKNTLSVVCSNDEVYQLYGGKRNGLAMLCTEFFPDSQFAKALDRSNLNTCIFVDSSVFKNTNSLNK